MTTKQFAAQHFINLIPEFYQFIATQMSWKSKHHF